MWAGVCCIVGMGLLAMALGYWSWPHSGPAPSGLLPIFLVLSNVSEREPYADLTGSFVKDVPQYLVSFIVTTKFREGASYADGSSEMSVFLMNLRPSFHSCVPVAATFSYLRIFDTKTNFGWNCPYPARENSLGFGRSIKFD